MSQVIGRLPSKPKALSSIPSTTKKPKRTQKCVYTHTQEYYLALKKEILT
jgi:hypothetical protein